MESSRKQTVIERCMLFILPVYAYLFCSWLVFLESGPNSIGLGAAILTLLFCGVMLAYMAATGGVNRASVAWLVITALLGCTFFLYPESVQTFFTFFAVIFCSAMTVFTAGENRRRFCSDRIFEDTANAVFTRPFSRFGQGYFATLLPMFHVKQEDGKSRNRTGLWILLGLLASIPLTVIVISLLTDADLKFGLLFDKVLLWLEEHFLLVFFKIFLAVPLCFYLFGMLYASRHPRNALTTDERREQIRLAGQKIPQVLIGTMLIPPTVIYLLYIGLQSSYYFSGFAGILPADFTVANYARSGFFEVCIVAGINATLLFVLERFCCRREDGEKTLLHRIFSIVLPVVTLLLLASSAVKLVMYIRAFGLTKSRLGGAWATVLLILVFAAALLGMLVKKLSLSRIETGIVTVAVLVALLTPQDRLIAEYNVDAYLSGRTEQMDVNYLCGSGDIGDGAIPALERLVKETDEKEIRDRAQWEIDNYIGRLRGARKGEKSYKLPWYVVCLQDLQYLSK